MTQEDNTRISACKFCKQMCAVEADTEEEAIYKATMNCTCADAKQYKELQNLVKSAKLEVIDMYEKDGAPEEIIQIMNECIEHMAEGRLKKVQMILQNGKKLQVTLKGDGFSVESSVTDKKKVDV